MSVEQAARDTALRRAVEVRLVASDVRWAWCFANDCTSYPDASSTPLQCIISYLSLIIYESRNYLETVDPTFGQSLALGNADIIEQSRHRTKMFDDTHLGMDGVVEFFSDQLIAAHKTFFIDRVRLPLAKSWKTDLTLGDYDGRQIATSHTMHFGMGTPMDMLAGDYREVLVSTGRDMGQYLRQLTDYLRQMFPEMKWGGHSFLSQIDGRKLTLRDVRSAKYYQSCFGGQLSLGLLASLDTFRCAVNSIDVMISEDVSAEAADALFKIRFITLYHLLSGLKQLRSEHAASLSAIELGRLDELLEHQDSEVFELPGSRPLRNTLIHYGLSRKCPTADLDLGSPLCGLSDVYLPGIGFNVLANRLLDHTRRVSQSLNEWADQRSPS